MFDTLEDLKTGDNWESSGIRVYQSIKEGIQGIQKELENEENRKMQRLKQWIARETGKEMRNF